MRSHGFAQQHHFVPQRPNRHAGPSHREGYVSTLSDARDQYLDRLALETWHGDGASAYRAGLASSEGQLVEALDFVRSNYSQAGYITPDSLAPTATESVTAVAKRHSKVIGTMSLWRDGAAGLQADEIYHKELNRLRGPHTRVGEVGRLAMDSRTPPVLLLSSLVGKIADAGYLRWNITDYVVECNPRHVGFYTKMMGFSVLGGTRECNQVGAPAVLLHVKATQLLHLGNRFGVATRDTAQKDNIITPAEFIQGRTQPALALEST